MYINEGVRFVTAVYICCLPLVTHSTATVASWQGETGDRQGQAQGDSPTSDVQSGEEQTDSPPVSDNARPADEDDAGARLECINWEGETVAEGSQYFPNDDFCHTCVCNRGFPIMCTSVLCSAPVCPFFEKVHGECCTYHCIEPPDHGPRKPNLTGTDLVHIVNGGAEDNANLGLRLLASTVTSFLVLALLLFMVHRLRQRRMLIMMRRMNAERNADDAYMSHFDQLDLGVDYTPYDDPPPPYTPPKPLDTPMGEAPPPYEERAAVFGGTLTGSSAASPEESPAAAMIQRPGGSAPQESGGESGVSPEVTRPGDRYGLSISVATLTGVAEPGGTPSVVVRLQNCVPGLEGGGVGRDAAGASTLPKSAGRRQPTGEPAGYSQLVWSDDGPTQSAARGSDRARAETHRSAADCTRYQRTPEEKRGGTLNSDGPGARSDNADKLKIKRHRSEESVTRSDERVLDGVRGARQDGDLNAVICQELLPVGTERGARQGASVVVGAGGECGPVTVPPQRVSTGDGAASRNVGVADATRSSSVTSQLSVCSETGERRQAGAVGRGEHGARPARGDWRAGATSHMAGRGGPTGPGVPPVYGQRVIYRDPGDVTSPVDDTPPAASPQGPCVRRLKQQQRQRPHSNPDDWLAVSGAAGDSDGGAMRRRSAGRDPADDPTAYTHYGFIDRPATLLPHHRYPPLTRLGDCDNATSLAALQSSSLAQHTDNAPVHGAAANNEKKRRKKRRSRNADLPSGGAASGQKSGQNGDCPPDGGRNGEGNQTPRVANSSTPYRPTDNERGPSHEHTPVPRIHDNQLVESFAYL